jgi:acyl-coenzyme A thioesterase PaaI-like protein
MIMKFEKYIHQAKKSRFGLFKLNFGLGLIIPFNKPHRIKIVEIGANHVKTRIPYKRKNLNHIKGIHACGMATAAEFSSGFLLLMKIGGKDYRLIMESLQMSYHYQAKKDVFATFSVQDDWLDTTVIQPLKSTDKIMVKCQIELHDADGNHVATGITNWQIKSWSKVKTKM